jgi:hypothetical protein
LNFAVNENDDLIVVREQTLEPIVILGVRNDCFDAPPLIAYL